MYSEWLTTLFQWTEGAVELRACPNERGKGRSRCIFTRDQDEVGEFVRRWDVDGHGVYFGVCTRQPDTSPPGTIETTAECPAVKVDIDKIAKDLALAALQGAFLPPSAIVDSGRGLHAYWLLKEPEDVAAALTNDHPLVALEQALARIFGGDRAVCDLARIMRLPGTR